MALLSKLEVKAPDKSLKLVSQAFVPRIPSTQATCLLQREEANERTIKIPEIPCLSCIFLFLSSFRIFFFKKQPNKSGAKPASGHFPGGSHCLLGSWRRLGGLG